MTEMLLCPRGAQHGQNFDHDYTFHYLRGHLVIRSITDTLIKES